MPSLLYGVSFSIANKFAIANCGCLFGVHVLCILVLCIVPESETY